VLVARRADRLEQLAGELPTDAKVIPCDLAADAASLAGRVEEAGAQVDLLVNNAGFGNSGPLLEQDAKRNAEQIRLNCESIVTLCHAFLPGMVERRRGGVINVASTAGMQPIPYEAVYAATKAFANSFTDALHIELRGTGVRVMSVNPGPVPTEWQQVAGYDESRSGVVPGEISAEQVVRESLEAFDRGKRFVIPGRTIRWFIRATQPSPRAVQLRVTERIYRPKR
jgi:short-subunit dehydrogenase